jgi:hypothetical protein
MTDERIGRFQKVVDECDSILIAKMAAARLGIEEVEKLENKYPDGIKFMEQYRKGEIKEPLLEQAHLHLLKAYDLPDEFPIRETVLSRLVSTETFKGSYEKYPNGEYGRRAERDKEDFKVLMERYPKEVKEVAKKPLGVVLPAAAAVIAGVIIAGFVLFFRKKQKSTDKSSG